MQQHVVMYDSCRELEALESALAAADGDDLVNAVCELLAGRAAEEAADAGAYVTRHAGRAVLGQCWTCYM